jgi:hypothetical protein
LKRYIPFVIVGILIFNGFGATAFQENNENSIVEKLRFSEPLIEDKGQYISIFLEEGNSLLMQPEQPILPAYRKTFIFPLRTKIIDVNVITSQVNQYKISKKVIQAPQPRKPVYSLSNKNSIEKYKINGISPSTELYPTTWFEYDVGCGLIKGERSIIVTINYYPIRIMEDTLYYSPKAEIKISYEKPSIPVTPMADAYDLLIITPKKFSATLQSFASHKESHNIATKIVTAEEIYDGTYFPATGRDCAEKIKYFIKNALDEWGITYVLLVGGIKLAYQEKWHLPVRYVHVFWADEYRYVSDLYFADIYDENLNFSSWDTDNNNIFSEWPKVGGLKDDVDLYPDVYLGRWACRNIFDLSITIQKTIRYENKKTKKKVVVVGGDNFEQIGYEGEVVGDKTVSFLSGFDVEKVYASQKDVNPQNIKKALGFSAMFMHLHGHGSPVSWSTHKPDTFNQWEEGIAIWDYPYFFNFQYPIVVYGGCHTSMFNISIFNHPYVGAPVRVDLSWSFIQKLFGGSIAALGYTNFPVAAVGETGDRDGNGVNELDCVEAGYGYMELGLFEAYGVENYEYLGECWGYTVSNYVEHYKLPYNRHDLHTIQGFVLLGDPSLKINSYETNIP